MKKWLSIAFGVINILQWINIPKGFPPHFRREVLNETKKLLKEGIIISKPTSYGLEVSLNPRMKGKIENIIQNG